MKRGASVTIIALVLLVMFSMAAHAANKDVYYLIEQPDSPRPVYGGEVDDPRSPFSHLVEDESITDDPDELFKRLGFGFQPAPQSVTLNGVTTLVPQPYNTDCIEMVGGGEEEWHCFEGNSQAGDQCYRVDVNFAEGSAPNEYVELFGYLGQINLLGGGAKECATSCQARGGYFSGLMDGNADLQQACTGECKGTLIFSSNFNVGDDFQCCLGQCSSTSQYTMRFAIEGKIDPTEPGAQDIIYDISEVYTPDRISYYNSRTRVDTLNIHHNIVDQVQRCDVEGIYYLSTTHEELGADPRYGHFSQVLDGQSRTWSKVYEVDYDLQESTCRNVQCHIDGNGNPVVLSNDFNPLATTNLCCGDDTSDTGTAFRIGSGNDRKRFICGITLRSDDDIRRYGHIWQDARAQGAIGDVVYISNPGRTSDYDVVSDGTQWVACGDQRSDSEVRNLDTWDTQRVFIDSAISHYYLCFEEGDETERRAFAECLGPDEVSFNDNLDDWLGYSSYPGDALPLALPLEQGYTDFEEFNPEGQEIRVTPSLSETTQKVEGASSFRMTVDVDANDGSTKAEVLLYLAPDGPNDWSRYSFLNLPLRFDRTGPVDMRIGYADGTYTTIENLLQYSISGYRENVWHLLRIPLQVPSKQITNVIFSIDLAYQNLVPRDYQFFIDTGFLEHKSSERKVRYCTEYDAGDSVSGQRLQYDWIEDLDAYDATQGIPKGQVACDQVGYTDWTGTRCCGDDGNTRESTYIKRSEFYADADSACWNGQLLENNTPLQVFSFSLDREYTMDCREDICALAIPPTKSGSLTISGTDAAHVSFENLTGIKPESTSVLSDSLLLNRSAPEIIYVDGELHGCYSYLENAFMTDDQGGQDYSSPLLRETRYTPYDGEVCMIVGDYFCDPHGYWSDDASVEVMDKVEPDPSGNNITYFNEGPQPIAINRTKVSQHFNISNEFSCCPTNYCWNGSTCMENMANEPKLLPVDMDSEGNGNRCIDGVWTPSTLKYDWDHHDSGYCPRETDCLVSNSTEYNSDDNPQCAASGTYVADYFCDEGSWSTRTKVLAANMLSLVPSDVDYTLFCDDYETAVNYAGTPEEQDALRGIQPIPGTFALNYTCDYVGTQEVEECVNNFCVLNYGENDVVVGTTLNGPLDVSMGPLFSIECPEGEAGFADCGGGWQWDESLQMIVYKPQEGGVFNFLVSLFVDIIIDPLISFITAIIGLTAAQPEVTSSLPMDFIAETSHFNTLYLAQAGEKSVLGVNERKWSTQEGRLVDYIIVSYAGMDDIEPDLCSYIEAYDREHDESADLVCTPTPNSISIASRTGIGTDLWVDLTGMLRLSGD